MRIIERIVKIINYFSVFYLIIIFIEYYYILI
jgi:hypothetical protein